MISIFGKLLGLIIIFPFYLGFQLIYLCMVPFILVFVFPLVLGQHLLHGDLDCSYFFRFLLEFILFPYKMCFK